MMSVEVPLDVLRVLLAAWEMHCSRHPFPEGHISTFCNNPACKIASCYVYQRTNYAIEEAKSKNQKENAA